MKKGFLSQSGSLQTKNKRSVNNKDTSNIPGKEEITQTSTIKLPNSLSKKQINSDNNSNARKNLLSSIFCSGCNIDHSSRNHATNDKSVYCVVCDDSVSPKKLVKLKENKLRKDNILKTYFTASNYSHNMTQQSICTFLRESVTHIFDNNMKYFENHPSLQYSKQSHQKSSFNMLIESDDSFTDTLFPGMSKPAGTNKSDVHSSLSSANRDVDDLNYLPTNLNELFYWHLFKLDYERVIVSSYNVLEGVKRRGDGTGNKMDAQTELILIPSITLEALGREVIDTVSRLSRAVSAMQLKSAPTLAHPPTDDQVFYGQLHEDDIKRMVRYPLSNQPNISCNSSAPTSSSLSFCVHNHFLGDEWCELVYRDAIRFVENEQMSEMKTWLTDPRDTSSDTSGTSRHATGGSDSDGPSTDVLSKMNEKVYKQHEWQSSAVSRSMAGAMPLMGWVDVGADTCLLEELYPALAEAVLQLHMLQFIINGLAAEDLPRLRAPLSGCTMLVYYPQGAYQPVRLDCNPLGGLDSGIRMTFAYTFSDRADDGRNNKLSEFIASSCASTTLSKDYDIIECPIENDQLIMHMSTVCRNGRNRASQSYFVLYFFSHGLQDC